MRRLAGVAGLMAVVASPGAAADVQAVIDLDRTSSGVTIVGKATAASAGIYDARMIIEKSGTSGRASTSQGRRLDLSAGQSSDVAQVGLSLQPGDQLAVTVEISRNGEIVSRTTSETAY